MNNNHSANIVLDGTLVSKLRADIEDIFEVVEVEVPRQFEQATLPVMKFFGNRSRQSQQQGTIVFVGHLLESDSEAAYETIAKRWRTYHYTPLLRRYKGKIALIGQPGLFVPPPPRNPWINIGLAVATALSVLFTGAAYECQCMPSSVADWMSGVPMMLTMMAILGAHEFGHYFTARYYKLEATLPYFIPMPFISPVGTMGAVIQLRSPFRTKRELFDVGIAGPIAGLIFAIPMIFVGVAGSAVHEMSREPNTLLEGNSIFYLAVKYLMHGQLLPSFDAYADLSPLEEFTRLLVGIIPAGGGEDILINSVAMAAWFGLLVTAINLLPVGQLDGGHVSYCLLGEKAQWLGSVLIAILLLTGLFIATSWIALAILLLLVIGPQHPPPLNDLAELGKPRKIIAYLMIIIFLLLFSPNPLQLI